jgi:hypothetical protein
MSAQKICRHGTFSSLTFPVNASFSLQPGGPLAGITAEKGLVKIEIRVYIFESFAAS